MCEKRQTNWLMPYSGFVLVNYSERDRFSVVVKRKRNTEEVKTENPFYYHYCYYHYCYSKSMQCFRGWQCWYATFPLQRRIHARGVVVTTPPQNAGRMTTTTRCPTVDLVWWGTVWMWVALCCPVSVTWLLWSVLVYVSQQAASLSLSRSIFHSLVHAYMYINNACNLISTHQ